MQLVYGNKRFYGLHEAEKIWAKQGGSKWQGANFLAVYMQLTDEQMEAEFVLENSNRTRASIYEDQLTVRAELAKNKSWDDIALLLKQPKQEVLRTHRPLTEAHIAVVQSFSAGAVSRAKVLRIVQTVKLEYQAGALEDESIVPARPAKQQTIKVADVPRESIAALINYANLKGASPDDMPRHVKAVSQWFQGLPAEGTR